MKQGQNHYTLEKEEYEFVKNTSYLGSNESLYNTFKVTFVEKDDSIKIFALEEEHFNKFHKEL